MRNRDEADKDLSKGAAAHVFTLCFLESFDKIIKVKVERI